MSFIGEQICIALNSLAPRKPGFAAQGESYSEAEYRHASNDFDDCYGKYGIELEGRVVLDAGCGAGGKTAFYAQQGCEHIYGVDREDVMVEAGRELFREKGIDNASLQVADLEYLPFESNAFDVIFLNGVLEHIVRPKLS